jgi:DNA-binding CsgD family transcriptional regulator
MPFALVSQLTSQVPPAHIADFPLLSTVPPTQTPPFQVGAQLLGLLGKLQATGPVAIVVDDVQWADQTSVQALGFVLRRLRADAVLAVLVLRSAETGEPRDATTEAVVRRLIDSGERMLWLSLAGLETSEVAELARQTLGKALGPRAVADLCQQTEGNPLYLQTLMRELPLEEWAGGMLQAPASLTAAVGRALKGLPEDGRRLVEAAAILGRRVPLPLAAQVGGVADPAQALEAALEAGLLRWWPAESSTPVVAAVPPRRLRALHAAAAPLVDRMASWGHRVGAAEGPDDHLAKELDLAAAEMAADGHAERAATLLMLSSQVSGTRAEKERRLLTAAAHLMMGDKHTQVQQMLHEVQECASCPLRSMVLGAYATSRGALDEAQALLTEALQPDGEPPAPAPVAAMTSVWLGRLYTMRADGEAIVAVSRGMLESTPVDGPTAQFARVNLAVGRAFVEGPRAGVRELSGLPPAADVLPDQAIALSYRGILHTWSGALIAATEDLTTVLRLGQDTGCAMLAEFVYPTLTVAQYSLGAWNDASISADKGLLVLSTEDKPWAYPVGYAVASCVPSGRGEWDRSEELLAKAEEWAELVGPGLSSPVIASCRAILCQAAGDHAGMLTALRSVLESQTAAGAVNLTQLWWRPLQVEALIETGHLVQARKALADLELFAEQATCLRLAVAWLSGRHAEQRGEQETALSLYQQGMDLPPTSDDLPFHKASLEHAYGRALGTAGQQRSAIATLQKAQERFTLLGATPFLERSQADLLRLGPTGTRTHRSGMEELTEREREIAHLVGRGMTNKEIAGELFISPKTVEYHLGHVYARLGLTSRRQLRDHIQQQTLPM